MMKKIKKTIFKRLKFEQKKEWDKLAYAFLKKNDWILDVGCGEGRFIAQNPKKIKGLDLNKDSIKVCQRKGYQVIKGDARHLPFKKESVPAIHCSHLIEHFFPQEVHQILFEFNRVLKPKGILVIRSPFLWNQFYSDLTHIRPYNPGVISRYLAAKGQSQHALKPISQDYQTIFLKWRYQPLVIGNKYFDLIFNALNHWGFPWLKKNGYLLVMKKEK